MENKFILYLRDIGLSKNSIDSYIRDLKVFEKYYFNSYGENLEDLTRADITMYIQYLRNHNTKASTINRKLTSLKHYNEFLIEENVQEKLVITHNDIIKVQKPMINKMLISEQTINKIKHIANRDPKNPDKEFCIIIILTNCGVRADELVNIKLSDILFNEGLINIYGKGNKFRQVVLNNVTKKAIKDYLRNERDLIKTNNPSLFIGQKNKHTKEPYNINYANRLLNKYKKILNLDVLYPHLLRSYFCTTAIHKAGYSIDQVAHQAGHSSLNTTKGYIMTAQPEIRELANKL